MNHCPHVHVEYREPDPELAPWAPSGEYVSIPVRDNRMANVAATVEAMIDSAEAFDMVVGSWFLERQQGRLFVVAPMEPR